MPSLCSSTNPHLKHQYSIRSLFFRQSIATKHSAALKSQFSTQCWSMILYDSHFWGKNPCCVSFRNNEDHYFNFSQLPISSKLSLVPPFLLLCISSSGFGRWLWKKAVGKILCHSSRGSVVPGPWLASWRCFWQWLHILILHMCFHQLFLMHLLCCPWLLPSQGQSWHHPTNTLSFPQENSVILCFLTHGTGRNNNSKLLWRMNWGWLGMGDCSTWSWELSLQWKVVLPGKLCLSICSLDLDSSCFIVFILSYSSMSGIGIKMSGCAGSIILLLALSFLGCRTWFAAFLLLPL